MAATSVMESWGTCLGFEQVTALTAAIGLSSIPDGTRVCVISAETQNVRVRSDGTNPTAAIGFIIRATGEPFVFRGNPKQLKFFEAAATAKLNVEYYGQEPSANS